VTTIFDRTSRCVLNFGVSDGEFLLKVANWKSVWFANFGGVGIFKFLEKYFQVAKRKDDGIGHFFKIRELNVMLETTGVSGKDLKINFHIFMSCCACCFHATSNIVFMEMELSVSFSFQPFWRQSFFQHHSIFTFYT